MASKLIRDRVPDAIRADGRHPDVRTAADEEMPGLLSDKLLEECGEVLEAGPDEILEELADVLEVLYAVARLHGHTPFELNWKRRAKAAQYGEFTQKHVLTLEERPTDAME